MDCDIHMIRSNHDKCSETKERCFHEIVQEFLVIDTLTWEYYGAC